jgi:hypothetical protein
VQVLYLNILKIIRGIFVLFGTDIVPNGTVIVQKGTVRGHKKGTKLRLVRPIFLAYFLY